MIKSYYVYIMTNVSNRVLYIGVTNSVARRAMEHRIHLNKSFTDSYNVCKLVYYEGHIDITDAIRREKQLKKWRRAWKEELITRFNPTWRDLFADL